MVILIWYEMFTQILKRIFLAIHRVTSNICINICINIHLISSLIFTSTIWTNSLISCILHDKSKPSRASCQYVIVVTIFCDVDVITMADP